MQKLVTRYLKNSLASNSAALSKDTQIAKVLTQANARCFSSLQQDMEKFDFSDKLNVEELKLKNPEKT